MMRALVLYAGFVAGSCFGATAFAENVPGSMRVIAEWEPVETVIVRWPPVHNPMVYPALDRAASLTVLLPDADARSDADEYFAGLGIDLAGINYIGMTAPVSPWPRDWGPYAAFDADGGLVLVDPLFDGYPYMGQSCNNGYTSVYRPPQLTGDQAANAQIAQALGLGYAQMPAYATGGNLLVDGFGSGFSSCLMVAENVLNGVTETQMRDAFSAHLGISNLSVFDNWESFGIQHIDCWAKWVNEETVLVKRVPAGHPEFAPTEANVAQLQSMTSTWGNPLTIIRVDSVPYDADGHLTNYLNSYIVNDTVLVPTFDVPEADEAALAVYRATLPGYNVIGVPAAGVYNYMDAIHCRTRSVYDASMVRIAHNRIRGEISVGAPVQIDASITAYSGAELDNATIWWREVGAGDWVHVPLEVSGRTSSAQAVIAGQLGFGSPTRVEYFIVSSDELGHTDALPLVGAEGPIAFDVVDEGLSIELVQRDEHVEVGEAATVTVRVVQGNEQLQGEVLLKSQAVDGGSVFTTTMTRIEGTSEWTGTLPAFLCGHDPKVWVEAIGSNSGIRTWPAVMRAAVDVGADETLRALDVRFGEHTNFQDAGWSATGLWNITEACSSQPGCSEQTADAAFVSSSCTYATGAQATGVLASPAIAVPSGEGWVLRICHVLETENSVYGFQGYDIASIIINGEPVLSPILDTDGWDTLQIDMTPYAGTTTQISFNFDSIDERFNDFGGWRVGAVSIDRQSFGCDASCVGDIDRSGIVDISDLLRLLSAFNASPSADISLNGQTGIEDLLQLLSVFGESCN